MRVMHMAFGGCFTAPPVPYGLTEDTGGHIAYILGAAEAQAQRPSIASVDIVTRAFDCPDLPAECGRASTRISAKLHIRRLRTDSHAYLSKTALEAELPALKAAFLHMLATGPRPDVIHAHFADAAEVALAAKARFGIPVIYTPHSLGCDKAHALGRDPALTRRIAREWAAIAGADAIVVSSRNEAEGQIEAYGVAAAGRTYRIDPGVTLPRAPEGTELADALLAPWLDDPTLPLVLAIARPVAKKNLPALLDAFAASGLAGRANLAILAGQRTGLDAGSPEQSAQIAALIEGIDTHGLRGHVALPARHDGAQVTQLYRLARQTGGVFVNPALQEPFGLTLIEAAAAGLPCIATCNGGPADILPLIGHGETVDPTDTGALADAIHRGVTDRTLWRTRVKAARSGLGPYDWTRYARRLTDLCVRLTRPAAPTRPHTARRMLVCDIDGTLTGSPEGAARFTRWAETRDMPFAVATGRSVSEARRVLETWDLPQPDLFITSVGSEIYAPRADGTAAPMDSFADAIAPGWDADAVTAILADFRPQDRIEQRRFKRSYLGGQGDALAIHRTLRRAGLDAQVIHSHGDLIDVLPARAGKGAAIAHAAATMGLTLADCISAGDSGNDATMLRATGAAILVANALEELTVLLPPRDGLIRATAPHADGVLDGLAQLGLAPAQPGRPAPARVRVA